MDDMDEGLLKLTNHREHPTNKAYKVFYFRIKEQSDFFEENLKSKGLYYETDIEVTNRGKLYLFGIRKTDLRIVQELNNIAIGKFRTPFIEKKINQYIVILIGVIIVVFSILSFFKNNV